MTAQRIVAGASGYSFKEWKGTFYPEKMEPGKGRVVQRASSDG